MKIAQDFDPVLENSSVNKNKYCTKPSKFFCFFIFKELSPYRKQSANNTLLIKAMES